MPYDPTKDPYYSGGPASQPARKAAAVTPNDATDLATYAKALFIGTAGTVVLIPVDNADGETVTFAGLANGQTLAVSARRVLATGTTATNIIAFTR